VAEVIVALDLPSADEARRFLDRIPDVRWVKVGPMLFLGGGAPLIHELKSRGARVFLDLKWHDIPHAVTGAVRAAVGLGVDLATVHALGGEDMMRAAWAAATGTALRLVGVSVLTSHSPAGYFAAVGRNGGGDLGGEVARLARAAVGAGLSGVVASPHEIALVREVVGAEPWIVVPGIRPPGSAPGDQQRTADAASAARAGATHLVVGRPVTEAANPRAVYQELCDSAG
jgi:orotidine-5'-phosphate decarboxylase